MFLSDRLAAYAAGSWGEPVRVDLLGRGGQHHQLCVLDKGGARCLERLIGHDVAGLAGLDKKLLSLGERLPIAIERAGGLAGSDGSKPPMAMFGELRADPDPSSAAR